MTGLEDLPLFGWQTQKRCHYHLHGRYAVTVRDGWPAPIRKTIVRRFDAVVKAVDEHHAMQQLTAEFGTPDPTTGKTSGGIQWLRFDRGQPVKEKP